jgi:hypothetical protein
MAVEREVDDIEVAGFAGPDARETDAAFLSGYSRPERRRFTVG